MARRPSGHYELVENLDRFSLFDEAFSVMTPVAMQRRSDDGAAQMFVRAPGVDLARRVAPER